MYITILINQSGYSYSTLVENTGLRLEELLTFLK